MSTILAHNNTKVLGDFVQANPHLTNVEIAKLFDVTRHHVSRYRKGQRHAIAPSLMSRGTELEERVSEILTAKGIAHELMPHGHVYDIELPNGMRVDVKGAYRTFKPPSSNCSPYYQFQSRKTQAQYIDLYILVVVPTMDFFIMPEREIGNKSIRLVWPGIHRESKWAAWHNRFDLLR